MGKKWCLFPTQLPVRSTLVKASVSLRFPSPHSEVFEFYQKAEFLQEWDYSQAETAGSPLGLISLGLRLQICNFQHLHPFFQIEGNSYKAVMGRAQLIAWAMCLPVK